MVVGVYLGLPLYGQDPVPILSSFVHIQQLCIMSRPGSKTRSLQFTTHRFDFSNFRLLLRLEVWCHLQSLVKGIQIVDTGERDVTCDSLSGKEGEKSLPKERVKDPHDGFLMEVDGRRNSLPESTSVDEVGSSTG